MKECFGEVNNGIVLRNASGETAHQLWLQIPEHHNAVTLDQFIVMPNHIHRIIELKGDRYQGQFENHVRHFPEKGVIGNDRQVIQICGDKLVPHECLP